MPSGRRTFLLNLVGIFVSDGFFRLVGGVLGWLARGVGLRRLSRLSKVIAGVGFGYAGSVILSGGSVQKARGWRAKFRAATTRLLVIGGMSLRFR